jgi:spore germination protein KB
MLLAGLVLIPIGLLLGAVAHRAPRLGLVDQATLALGKWPGRMLGALFVLGTGVLAAYAVRAGAQMIGLLMLPRTPPWVISLVIVLQGAVGAWFGLEVVARAAVMAFLCVGAVLLALIPGFIPMFDARRLFPLLASGAGPLLRSAAVSAGFWGQVVLLAMSAESFRAPGELRASALRAGAASLASGWLLFVLAQGSAGWYGVSEFAMPNVEVMRAVRFYLPLLERVDVLVVTGWTAMGFVEVAWLLWALARGVTRLAGAVDSRPFVVPVAAAIWGASLLAPEDLASLLLRWTRLLVPLATGTLVLTVTVVWLAAVVRGLAPPAPGGAGRDGPDAVR